MRNPGFSAAVIVTLALSIGANTAIFSIVNALMLKSLPYRAPERIGTIFWRIEGSQPFDGLTDIDGEQWELLRDNVSSLVGAVSNSLSSGVNLRAGRSVEYVHAGRVSAHYFDVLGIRPVIGRTFTEDEDRPHGPKAVILSYSLWRNTFHADPDLIGQAVELKGEPYTVVGVLPAGARTPLNAALYTALQPGRLGEGAGANYSVILRLRDGVNWQRADAEINRAWADPAIRFARDFHPGSKISFYAVPLQKGQSAEVLPKALTLMFAAGFILLIACANLAGLTVVRMARRTSEIATRMALGASRWQIQRQLWIENLLLAVSRRRRGSGRWLFGIARAAVVAASGLPAGHRRFAGWTCACFLPGGVDSYQCALWHAACACPETNRSSIVHGNPHHRGGGALTFASGAHRGRSRAHGGAARRQRFAYPHVDPSAEPPAGVQSARRDDCQGFPG